MKRFIFSTLMVAVFFLGVGALVEKTTAKFKSDDKALELVRKARAAIGGDSAIAGVQSLRIVGHTTRTFNVDGASKTSDGDTEIAMMLPDKLMRSESFAHGEAGTQVKSVMNEVNVVKTGDGPGEMKVRVHGDEPGEMKVRVGAGHGEGSGTGVGVEKHVLIKGDDGTVKELTGADAEKYIAEHPAAGGEQHVFVRKADGTTVVTSGDGKIGEPAAGGIIVRKTGDGNATFERGDAKTVTLNDDNRVMLRTAGGEGHEGPMRDNGMLRLTLSLLMTSPQGMDVEYIYGGEADVDGTACNIVVASFGGQSFKIFLSKASDLPVAMAYSSASEPKVMTFTAKVPDSEKGTFTASSKDGVTTFNKVVPAPGDGEQKVMTYTARASDGTTDPHGNVMFKRVGGPEAASYMVKFSDYRTVNGVQLPYTWTTTANGAADSTFNVTSYEINPANISEKFQGDKVMVRTHGQ